MLEGGQEFPCVAVDLSASGLRLKAEKAGYLGSRVVVYLDKFGRLEGKITRATPDGFAMTIEATQAKREKLVAQLTELATPASTSLGDKRRHQRIAPEQRQTVVTLHDGSALQAEIIDLSLSGVLFSCRLALEPGMTITVGSRSARVVRVTAKGVAAQFVEPLEPEELNASTIL